MPCEDFLVEIGTQELPPGELNTLSDALCSGVCAGLAQAGIALPQKEDTVVRFATPRRLALLIKGVPTAQPDRQIERRGPAVKTAFDQQGLPTRACEGFARSCGVSVDALRRVGSGVQERLVCRTTEVGQNTCDLLADIVRTALANLPVARQMRWGTSRTEFVRPVQWLVMLFGQKVIECEILGIQADRTTRGHRFHCDRRLSITEPAAYEQLLLTEGFVITDSRKRRDVIRQQVQTQADALGANALTDDTLLDEVTALCEWPVALTGHFDPSFLSLPTEALISSMQGHQKYFPVVNPQGALEPAFVFVANIDSKEPQKVISGNERVIRPRLADARFFYESDQKISLGERQSCLKGIVFQAQLGSLFDKSERVTQLAASMAVLLGADSQTVQKAAMLCKSDLASTMVGEFPELQGIMGQYYAHNDGEPPEVCQAIAEHYLPRFAGDSLPSSKAGSLLAIADRVDTITGIFGIKQPPSGSKDPFSLRRAAMGILRILIEQEIDLNLYSLIDNAMAGYRAQDIVFDDADSLCEQIGSFVFGRLRAWYQDRGIGAEVFLCVQAISPSSAVDFDHRVKAVAQFMTRPEATALAAAHKRVSNLLARSQEQAIPAAVDPSLMIEAAEHILYTALGNSSAEAAPLLENREYGLAMNCMAGLREPVDTFFDQVMVNVEDERVRLNRLSLLQQLRDLFMHIADIALLPQSTKTHAKEELDQTTAQSS